MLMSCNIAPRRGRRWFLLLGCWRRRGDRSSLLCVSYEIFDEVHVLIDELVVDAVRLEVGQEGVPGGVDAGGDKAVLGIVAHVPHVGEQAFSWSGHARLVNLPRIFQ